MIDAFGQILEANKAMTAITCTELGVPVPECCKSDSDRLRDHQYAEDLAIEDKLNERKGNRKLS